MKGIFLVLAIVMALGCVGRQKAKTSDQTETKLVAGDRVEVMYFHGKQRCITCRSIEQQVREVLAESFGEAVKAGKVVFREVDISDEEGEKVADRYEVSWSSLFVNRWKGGQEIRHNMTDFAFGKAVGDAEGFKEGLREKIAGLMK